jgi:hypothetical protein
LPLGKLLRAYKKSLWKLLGKLLGVCKMHLGKLLEAYRKLLRKLLGSCKKGPIKVRISNKLYIIIINSYIRGE